MRTNSSGNWSPLVDGLGSLFSLYDGTGASQTEYTYSAFGQSAPNGMSTDNSTQYTGRENDDTGLQYDRARYYSPAPQRFISEDPLGFGGGDINIYAYTSNSPTNFTDPFGLEISEIYTNPALNWTKNPPSLAGRGGYPPKTPEPNRCGSGWTEDLVPDNIGTIDLTGPCQKHDDCYGTCGEPKRKCDSGISDDVWSDCDNMPQDCVFYPKCHLVGGVYGAAVTVFGGPAYRNAQRGACK